MEVAAINRENQILGKDSAPRGKGKFALQETRQRRPQLDQPSWESDLTAECTTAGLCTGNSAAPPACRLGGPPLAQSWWSEHRPPLQIPPPAAFQFFWPSSACFDHLGTTGTGELANPEAWVFTPAQSTLKRPACPSSSAGRVLPLEPGGRCAGEAQGWRWESRLPTLVPGVGEADLKALETLRQWEGSHSRGWTLPDSRSDEEKAWGTGSWRWNHGPGNSQCFSF